MGTPSFLSSLSNPYKIYNSFQNPTTKKGLASDIGGTLNSNNLLMNQQQGQRNAETSTLFPQYEDMLNSGYSSGEKASIVGGALTPIGGAYGAAKGQAANRLARTRNSAGYGSFLGELARNQAQDTANASSNTQLTFADEKEKRSETGLAGIANLYGIDTSFLSALGNQQLGALGQGNEVEARRKGVLGNIGAAIHDVGGIFGIGNGIGNSIAGLKGKLPLGPGFGSGRTLSSVYGG